MRRNALLVYAVSVSVESERESMAVPKRRGCRCHTESAKRCYASASSGLTSKTFRARLVNNLPGASPDIVALTHPERSRHRRVDWRARRYAR